jgi:hypothetical protein
MSGRIDDSWTRQKQGIVGRKEWRCQPGCGFGVKGLGLAPKTPEFIALAGREG